MRRVLYVSGTRAEFGLMLPTLKRIDAHPRLALQIAVTGMHLSSRYGLTVTEIEASGLPIVARIPIDVDAPSKSAMARGIGEMIVGLTGVIGDVRPDLLLLDGDRGEMLAAAIAGLYLGIPVVHLHGGERSGSVDESVRHAITKMSHWHFVATEESRERVLRMGEHPDRVRVTGAPGLDDLAGSAASSRAAVLAALKLPEGGRFVLALFHPIVQESDQAFEQTRALQGALEAVLMDGDMHVVWIAPNADAGSAEILRAGEGWSAVRVRFVTHLPRPLYLSALAHAEVLIGNSSSGIVEAASFGTPVVNVGSRQHLRERNANTLDCAAEQGDIAATLTRALRGGRFPPQNRYGDGHAAERIAELLATIPIGPDVLRKSNTY